MQQLLDDLEGLHSEESLAVIYDGLPPLRPCQQQLQQQQLLMSVAEKLAVQASSQDSSIGELGVEVLVEEPQETVISRDPGAEQPQLQQPILPKSIEPKQLPAQPVCVTPFGRRAAPQLHSATVKAVGRIRTIDGSVSYLPNFWRYDPVRKRTLFYDSEDYELVPPRKKQYHGPNAQGWFTVIDDDCMDGLC